MKEKLKSIFGLRADQESGEKIKERIESGAQITGTNMYILICAVIIASIGLNMNSTAVVIGAMLISPIMGEIISVAYGISNNDLVWIRKSLMKFLLQISICIITSTIYFALSPIQSFSSELAARTQPTLWDVLIALFGGFAAIIANTRKNLISNVVPGTAIATALMPPLCTIGYCLASGKWTLALGAGYLFFINALCICLASVLGLRIMWVANPEHKIHTWKSQIIIIVFIILSIIPSVVLGWQSVNKVLAEEHFNAFLRNEFQFEDTYVVKSNIQSKEHILQVMLAGSMLNAEQIQTLNDHMTEYKLDQYELNLVQVNRNQAAMQEELQEILAEQSGENQGLLSTEEAENREIVNLYRIQKIEEQLHLTAIEELKILFPFIQSAGFSNMYSENGETQLALVLVVEQEFTPEQLEQMQKWINKKMDEEVRIIQTKSKKNSG